MPWLVSIRMMGDVIGTPRITITRMSVIFRSLGFELVLVFCGSASSVSSTRNPLPHVGYLQIARFRIGVGVLRKRFQRFVNQESGGQRPGGFLKKGTPSVDAAASRYC